MSICDVQHQNDALWLLQRALASGRTPHGYLFYGPEGVGKELAATRFARILLCHEPRTINAPGGSDDDNESSWLDACGQCPSCLAMQAGTHGDFELVYRERIREIEGQSAHLGTVLGIDVIRNFVIHKASLKPTQGHGRVFVIRDADRMSNEAQNSLLKILEEPPARTHLILLAEWAGQMLPTIRSRSWQVQFRTLPAEFVADRLAQHDIAPDEAAFLGRFSGGRLGVALKLAEYALTSIQFEAAGLLGTGTAASADDLQNLLRDTAAQCAEQISKTDSKISKTEAQRMAYRIVLRLLAAFYRDAAAVHVGGQPQYFCDDTLQKALQTATNHLTLDDCLTEVQRLADAEFALDHNAHLELMWTNLLLADRTGRRALITDSQ